METSISGLAVASNSANPSSSNLRTYCIAQRWASGTGGGSERVVDELASHLPGLGVNLSGFVTGPSTLAEASGGSFRSFAPSDSSMLARLRGARSIIGSAIVQEKPDLVVSHFALYAFPVLDKIGSTPHVVHFHGPWAAESLHEDGRSLASKLKRAVERRVYQRAQCVIVLSHAFRQIAIQDYGIAPHRIRLIPGSVDVVRFAVPQSRLEARTLLGWPTDRPILVAVRRLVSRMGLDRLIEAMRQVVEQVPDVLLYIGGKGKLAASLQQQVQQAGLDPYVKFLGFVPEEQLPLVYRAADLNVVPTLALEGFGLVAVEAMAAGTPSLVTPVGGLPEIVSELCQDLVVPSTSISDLARQLISVLTGRIRLPEDETCRTYIAANFTSQLMAQRTADVYREVYRGDLR